MKLIKFNSFSKVRLKSRDDIKRIREAGLISAGIFKILNSADLTGLSTFEIDSFISGIISKKKARPAFRTIKGYAFSSAISVNEELVHGIPSKEKVIVSGDLVKIDIGVIFRGYFSDSCVTYIAGNSGKQNFDLVNTARLCMYEGIAQLIPGRSIQAVGQAIEDRLRGTLFRVVRECSGHGTGFCLHESPLVPNFHQTQLDFSLDEGMVLTIEPVITKGNGLTKKKNNGWTGVSADGSMAAQFEHTVAVTASGPQILTEH